MRVIVHSPLELTLTLELFAARFIYVATLC